MGIPVLVMGASGSGKSRSLKNFKQGELSVINVAGKPLPFRSELASINVRRTAKERGINRYALIKAVLAKAQAKSIAIDDTQYLLAFDSKAQSMKTFRLDRMRGVELLKEIYL